MNHLDLFLKCRFWFSRAGIGTETPHFCFPIDSNAAGPQTTILVVRLYRSSLGNADVYKLYRFIHTEDFIHLSIILVHWLVNLCLIMFAPFTGQVLFIKYASQLITELKGKKSLSINPNNSDRCQNLQQCIQFASNDRTVITTNMLFLSH